jgi:(Z)-2-((N-methylformamido)methylene)-5-hydroxybutyrolactone dehydrogenase
MQVVETPVAGEVRHYQMLIGGEWVNTQSGRTFESINPYTGKVWAVVPEASEADVDAAVRAARAAFDKGPWGRMTGTERARLMRRLAALLEENAEHLATVESTDNGKLIREMGGSSSRCPNGTTTSQARRTNLRERQSPATSRTFSSTRAAKRSGW